MGFLPALLERLFRGLMGVEAWCVRRGLSFPLGASVVALARQAARASSPRRTGPDGSVGLNGDPPGTFRLRRYPWFEGGSPLPAAPGGLQRLATSA